MDSVEGFFYGLYMDPDLLISLGFTPSAPRIASIDDYELDIRGAAKIIPKNNSIVWGTLIQLSKSELYAMYSFETTKDYKPEFVVTKTLDGEVVNCVCYNLPINKNAVINLEYLQKLLVVANKLGLPKNYITTLETIKQR